MLIQQHHYQAVPTHTINLNNGLNEMGSTKGFSSRKSIDHSFSDSICSLSSAVECKMHYDHVFFFSILTEYFNFVLDKRKSSMLHSPAGPMVTVEPSKALTLLWGATGEQVIHKFAIHLIV